MPIEDNLIQEPNTGSPQPKKQITQQPTQGLTPEMMDMALQQAAEQLKFELKKELSTSINSKANSLRDVDPATATALQACAIAIGEAQSSVMPLGGNSEFEAQQGQQAQPKQAEDVDDFIFQTMLSVLEENNWLEENANESQEKLASDLQETFSQLKYGLEKFQLHYDVDFSDRNTWDLLEDIVRDGTLMSYSE